MFVYEKKYSLSLFLYLSISLLVLISRHFPYSFFCLEMSVQTELNLWCDYIDYAQIVVVTSFQEIKVFRGSKTIGAKHSLNKSFTLPDFVSRVAYLRPQYVEDVDSYMTFKALPSSTPMYDILRRDWTLIDCERSVCLCVDFEEM